MEAIGILLAVVIPVFLIVGSIVAFVALSKANKMTQAIELYRDMLSDLLGKFTTLNQRLSLLEREQDRPPEFQETQEAEETQEAPKPPPVPAKRPVETVQPLAPAPQQPEELLEPIPIVDVVEPRQPVAEPAAIAPEPEPALLPDPAHIPASPPPPMPAATPQQAQRQASQAIWSNFESAAGKRWLTWAGVIILFLSVAFFLKHLFDIGWIGPGVQVLMAVGAGLAMLALGEYFLRQDMRPLGRGLIGGGIMVLYAALFAAYSPDLYKFYNTPVIKSQQLTFALMCVVTIAAMVLAIRHDAISISFLAILGGMLTPVLLRTGADPRDALFSYILLLDLGVLGVAFYKKWRALDILAFIGTLALFWGWWTKFGVGAPVGPPLAWLAAFWAVFAIVPAAHHLRHKTELTIERLVMSLANATCGFGFAYHILTGRPDDLAWVSLVMSGAYLTLGVLVRLRTADTKAMFGFLSLAMMFLTLFPPLHFALNGITLAWLAEAVVLVYLGFLFDYMPVRIGGFIALLLGAMRVFIVHNNPFMLELDQLAAFANTNFWTMMCAPIAGGMIAIVHQFFRRKCSPADKQIQLICTIGSGLLALVLLSFELDRWFDAFLDMTPNYQQYLNHCSKIVLWALGSTAFLAGAKSWMARPLRIAGLLPMVGSLLLVANTFTVGRGDEHMLAINPLFAATLLACGVMWAYSLTWTLQEARTAMTVAAGLATLLFFSLELDRWFWTLDNIPGPYLQYLHNCSMPVLWSLGALAFLAGAKYSSAGDPLRITGLVPLGAATLLIGYAFTLNPGLEPMLFISPRFAAAFFVCAVMWVHSLTWPQEQAKIGFCIISGYATTALLCAEVLLWVWSMAPQWEIDQHYTMWWAAGMLLALCAAVYLAAARTRSIAEAYSAGLAPLLIAWICVLRAYFLNPQDDITMFLNPRFVAAMITLGIVFSWPSFMRSDRSKSIKTSDAITPLYVWFTVSLLALLTVEPAGWLYHNIADRQESAWTVQMSISIVWGLYASAMLSIGFWKRVMPLRLAALALFGFTAIKLLLVDMANVEKIYRIVSFFVMGILMVAASYAYHKAEKQLKKIEQTSDDQ
jgi:uncharacterized membrane protein